MTAVPARTLDACRASTPWRRSAPAGGMSPTRRAAGADRALDRVHRSWPARSGRCCRSSRATGSGLGSAGYGLLLGCVGVGALAAADLRAGAQAVAWRRAPIYALACLRRRRRVRRCSRSRTASWSRSSRWSRPARPGSPASGCSVPPIRVSFRPGSRRAASPTTCRLPGRRSRSASLVPRRRRAGDAAVSTAFVVIAGALVVAALVTWPLALPASPAASPMAEPLPLPSVPDDLAGRTGPRHRRLRARARKRRAFPRARRGSAPHPAADRREPLAPAPRHRGAGTPSPRPSWSAPGKSTSASTRDCNAPILRCSIASTRCSPPASSAACGTHSASASRAPHP